MTIRISRAVALTLVAGLLVACDDAATADAGIRVASGARADGSVDAAPARDADVPPAMHDATAADAGVDAGSTDKCDRLAKPFDRTGESGVVVARFLSSNPVLEYKGYYDWALELRRPSGEAIDDAELDADAEMPAHGHGTTPITLRHAPGSLRYELREVNLFMAGKWEVSVTVRTSAGTDRVVFRACPLDPPHAGDEEGDGGAPQGGH